MRLIAGRILLSVVTLLLVSVLIFAIVEVLPGDVASRILGRQPTPESLAMLRERLHLNDPPVDRYVQWLGSMLGGDFGRSLTSSRPVTEVLAPRIFNTMVLSGFAFALYLPLSLIPAAIQALDRDRKTDHVLSVVTLVVLSIPEFLLATLFLLTFVVFIPILPAASVVDETTGLVAYLRALLLPGTTLAVVMAVYAVRMLRDNLIEVLVSDYVRMAELKGLPRRRASVFGQGERWPYCVEMPVQSSFMAKTTDGGFPFDEASCNPLNTKGVGFREKRLRPSAPAMLLARPRDGPRPWPA